MTGLYKFLIRPILFQQESEAIHDFTLNTLGHISYNPLFCDALASLFNPAPLPIELFGLRFPNPVGLAAGMDKRAAAVPVWESFGLGFTELGGVTQHAQAGNDKPRMFRAVADEALVNRMGFNNPGADAVAGKLMEWQLLDRWPRHPVGINLGKSKITPLEEAAEDYCHSFNALRDYADFFVVNVSSPNTPNLRKLQDSQALDQIMTALHELNRQGDSKPILVKIAPDLSFEALDEIVGLYDSRKVAGFIATNTTITRPETGNTGLKSIYDEAGGLSGRPLAKRSTEVIRHLFQKTRGRVPIIGVGGIFDADDAWDKITAGASLVQVYTGLVYEGPGIAKNIVNGLREKLAERNLASIADAVGINA